MATLQAVTASSGATVTDPDAVEQLCEAYCFGGLKWRLTDDGEFSVWGYEAFRVYAQADDGTMDLDANEVTREFLWKLAEYIEEDAELDIQSAGFTKCRYPVHACRYVIRNGAVLHADLGGLEALERGAGPQSP
ncbi:hypothetical protein [Saliphagus infecundisoli]|uniref:Uncharacterized protein n=1 Tax=Saliphagus infecundisoli TaxID=1849069 RepID=A0ABD5Q9D0_9EURY|nr:hypothetical protein [Saliphagus infecundisoli]